MGIFTGRKKEYEPGAQQRAAGYRAIIIVGVLLAISFTLLYVQTIENRAALARYGDKLALLENAVFTAETAERMGENRAGAAGYVVFLSLCDGETRAKVYHGTGETLKDAWKQADKAVRAALVQRVTEPLWLKADVVASSETVPAQDLNDDILLMGQIACRYGLAFDGDYSVALLEAELNGNRIYDYEKGGVSLSYLNSYLGEDSKLTALPENYERFLCFGWFCDEADEVYQLMSDGSGYGRRAMEATLDDGMAADFAGRAADYLLTQLRNDGSFVYGAYPRFGNIITDYSLEHHMGAVWALLRAGEPQPDKLAAAIDYALKSLRYAEDGTAYLYDEKTDESTLGANSMAVIAMTEYMDAFGGTQYAEVCRALGNGILSQFDTQTGTFRHVLNGAFSLKEEYRAADYDGEAIFALCRLYTLTDDETWLYAARRATDGLIAFGDVQDADLWLVYGMNELAGHVSDPDYYVFALQAVQSKLPMLAIHSMPGDLELLMTSIELYDRMMREGIAPEGLALALDQARLFEIPFFCAGRQLNDFFFPEYAMYMEQPARILDSFMARQDGCRVRIDDVQHGILGLTLYAENYERLWAYL